MNCPICQAATAHFGDAKIMGKHPASFRRCADCGFLFAPDPYWLPESYQSAINQTDIGSVSRADTFSRSTKAVIEFCLKDASRFLDYGAGYGIFVRKMRDNGYPFLAYDQYCENLFASDFKLEALTDQRFDLVTAFEVMEHLIDPLETFATIFRHADAVLFSTQLVPEPAPAVGTWWYFGLDHGQHISLYTRRTLELIASRHGKSLASDGSRLHLISSRRISSRWFRWLTGKKGAKLIELAVRRPSLLMTDFEQLRQAQLKKLGVPDN
ncbi:MAG: class I SAM-dependent methyltransferase [Opitutaceae bacterium]|nr:class I SAM-dependent methyltransferase [Opitutaceae bacterium]